MTGETFDEFCVVLANLSPGNAPSWNSGVMMIYQIGLRDVPNSAAAMLAEAVIDACTFRPAVAEIKALARQIAQSGMTAVGLVAHIMALLAEHGRFGRRSPDPSRRNTYFEGPPAALCAEGHAALAVFGGWVNFADNQDPAGVLRGQLLKVAQAVVDGTSSDTMGRLQLEYQEAAAQLTAPSHLLEAPYKSLGKREGNMTRMGALPLSRLTETMESAK